MDADARRKSDRPMSPVGNQGVGRAGAIIDRGVQRIPTRGEDITHLGGGSGVSLKRKKRGQEGPKNGAEARWTWKERKIEKGKHVQRLSGRQHRLRGALKI